MRTGTEMAMTRRQRRWRTRIDTTRRTRMIIRRYTFQWTSCNIQYTYNDSHNINISSSLSNLKSNSYNKNDTKRKTATPLQNSTRRSAMMTTTMKTSTTISITIIIKMTTTITIVSRTINFSLTTLLLKWLYSTKRKIWLP